MPLARRATLQFKNMNIGVSYRINEEGNYLQDALNVVSNQGRLETRRGMSRYNAVELPSAPLSLSFYNSPGESKKILAKCEGSIYSVDQQLAHTEIKSGLSTTLKHRAINANGRHIIACGGLYTYNGTIFTQLGQNIPSTPNASMAGSGGSLAAGTYYVGYSFYASSIGFETNISTTAALTAAANDKITFGAPVPATADNALIDKVRVYIKSGVGDYLFVQEVSLAATPSQITVMSTSTQVAPDTHDVPPTTAKYLAWFNSRLVVSGITNYESDVYFSEQDIPDAFDNSNGVRLYIPGDGPVMGMAVGFFNNSVMDPFLIIFKKRQTYVYSEIGGNAKLSEIDSSIGCISQDSVQTINGNVYFMSESGFRVIIDGRIAQNKNVPVTLANGAIDDIFNSPGYVYELNKANAQNFHSVYLGREKRYITFVSEATETRLIKAYAYELEYGGFKPYSFVAPMTCSCRIEDDNGDESALLGTDGLYLMKHSDSEDRTDIDNYNNQKTINAFAQFSWIQGSDFDASYNFRQLVVKGLISENDIEVKGWTDYSFLDESSESISLFDANQSFTLDISKLDENVLGSGRMPNSYSMDINRRGKNICIGFYQNVINGNMGIIAMQLDFSKNGNRN